MKIVALDGYALNPGDLDWKGFEALGTFTCYNRSTPEEVLPRIGDAEAVIVNKTPINAGVIAAAPALRYIGVTATGYDIVDTEAAASRGIAVTNIPTYSTESVAQFVFTLLLEICHRAGGHSADVHSGRWQRSRDFCFWDPPLIELDGKTLGILGFGRIGRSAARIAEAFGMNVLAFSPSLDMNFKSGNTRCAPLNELLEQSDVISLHCPLNESTREIINENSISKMKDDVIIINTSRGALIAEQDLADALASRKVGAAGLDVLSKEPPDSGNPLIGAANCFITPHIAWAPLESRTRLMDIAVENLKAFLKGSVQNQVN